MSRGRVDGSDNEIGDIARRERLRAAAEARQAQGSYTALDAAQADAADAPRLVEERRADLIGGPPDGEPPFYDTATKRRRRRRVGGDEPTPPPAEGPTDLQPKLVTLEVPITEQMGSHIRSLLYGGLWGFTESEVAERLIAHALVDLFSKAGR